MRNNDILNRIRLDYAEYCENEFDTPFVEAKREFDYCLKNNVLLGIAHTTTGCETADDSIELQVSYDIRASVIVLEADEYIKFIPVNYEGFNYWLDFDFAISKCDDLVYMRYDSENY